MLFNGVGIRVVHSSKMLVIMDHHSLNSIPILDVLSIMRQLVVQPPIPSWMDVYFWLHSLDYIVLIHNLPNIGSIIQPNNSDLILNVLPPLLLRKLVRIMDSRQNVIGISVLRI